MASYQLDFTYADFVWGNHYIWRLTVAIVATSFVAFLTGAIAQRNGGKVALVSNIPSVFGWAALIYVIGFRDFDIPGGTGFIVISIVAMPVTLFLAYAFGLVGEQTQSEEFEANTIFGIRPGHWI